MSLPFHQSDKSLANQFASFFTQKIKRIRNTFSKSTTTVAPPMDSPPTCLTSVRCLRMRYLKSLPSDDLKNYHLVSGLCFMLKMVERVVVKQRMQHINSNNLDNPHQSVYKTGHSTGTALLHIKNEIHLSLSHGEPTALVLLDLSAAFDTIDHDTFLIYLKSWFGVCSMALKWFSFCLSHRFQAIKIGSTLSELHELLFGIPQGSVLGPLLFSLYTTPLGKVIQRHSNINFYFYVVDTQLSYKNATSAFGKLNSCLQDVQEWLWSSMLILNPEETEFNVF